MHKCDNPSCCNPEHLRVGTKKENSHDMLLKGRFNGRKLTDKEVSDMRTEYATGEITYAQLAAKYGMTPGNVGDIVRGEYYRWLLPSG